MDKGTAQNVLISALDQSWACVGEKEIEDIDALLSLIERSNDPWMGIVAVCLKLVKTEAIYRRAEW